MIIDIHTHIFPKAVREQRDRFYNNEPDFELLYSSAKSQLAGAKQLIAMMDEQAVDKAVTFGFPWRSGEAFKRHNDYVLEAVQRYPGRIIGFCCLDPMHPKAPDEAERCLRSGLAGIGELAFYGSDLDEGCFESLDPIMALGRTFDCPVMVHTNEPVGHLYPGKAPNTLARIYAMIRRYPQNRIILAHWGGGILFYALLKKEVSQSLDNVWFDSAASPFLYRPGIYKTAMELVGPDKVLLGTDYPLLSPRRYLEELNQSGLNQSQIERICYGNAAALLKLDNAGKRSPAPL